MSRKPWHALRALRVMLACLALWLPARAVNAALGPVDAVVMIAGGSAPSAAKARGVAPSWSNAGARGIRAGAARQGATFSAPSVDAGFYEQAACRADRASTANPSFVERLYLHCCVFLR